MSDGGGDLSAAVLYSVCFQSCSCLISSSYLLLAPCRELLQGLRERVVD